MRIYISLPISGFTREDVERRSDEAKRKLRAMGHEPVSPIDDVTSWDEQWIEYMIKDFITLKNCDGAVFLNGWENSYGCRIERLAVEKMGKRIIDLSSCDASSNFWH